jgi:hypothetical protein
MNPKEGRKMSRREFVRLSGIALSAVALAACGSSVFSLTQVPAPTSTLLERTVVPEATITAVLETPEASATATVTATESPTAIVTTTEPPPPTPTIPPPAPSATEEFIEKPIYNSGLEPLPPTVEESVINGWRDRTYTGLLFAWGELNDNVMFIDTKLGNLIVRVVAPKDLRSGFCIINGHSTMNTVDCTSDSFSIGLSKFEEQGLLHRGIGIYVDGLVEKHVGSNEINQVLDGLQIPSLSNMKQQIQSNSGELVMVDGGVMGTFTVSK